MAAIQEKAPEAEYFAVRIFDRELRTNMDTLLAAIQWSIDQQMDIVNLSLGTSKHAEKFAPFIARAIFVSPAGAYPGDLPGVIRVAQDPACPRDQYRAKASCSTHRATAPMPGVPPERNLNGVSFAVANITGLVARVCGDLEDRSYQSVLATLTG